MMIFLYRIAGAKPRNKMKLENKPGMTIKIKKGKLAPILVCGIMLASLTSQADEVMPTNVWNDFYSSSIMFNSNPAPVGSRVDAFDADNVLCGRFIIKTAGQYGFIQVYGDDNRTPNVDEGAEVDDLIRFELNGRAAALLGPANNNWISFPAIPRELDMSSSGTLGFSLIQAPGDKSAAPFDTVQLQIIFRNTGEVTDFYNLEVSSQLGWEILAPADPIYVEAGLGDQVAAFSVIVPGDLSGATADQISYNLSSGLDPSLGASGAAMIMVIATDVDDDGPLVPLTFELQQNYPNPFNPSTKIPFSLGIRSQVTISVFDLLGRRVDEMYLGSLSAGKHVIDYQPENFSSGIYFYKISAGQFSQAKRMVLLK